MAKNEWSNMYYCVIILLTKSALEHVHLGDEFVQNQLHIAGRLTRFPSHTINALQFFSVLRNYTVIG